MDGDILYLTQAQLAERWQVSEWGIWAMRKRGDLPQALRIGRKLRWHREVIEAWEEEQTRPADEFDPIYSARAEKALAGRGLTRLAKSNVNRADRGRPPKARQVEGRSE